MGLKKLLPLENYSVESSMSKNEVLGVLSDNSVKSGNTNTTNANFKGEILGDTFKFKQVLSYSCLLYTSPSPRDQRGSRMPSSA